MPNADGRRSAKTPLRLQAKKSTRRLARAGGDDESAESRMAIAHAAAEERRAKSQMALIGGIGGGGLLLLIIIVAAASSGSSRPERRAERKIVAPPPVVEVPKEKPKPTNYVRNTGAIVFVCGGTEKHPDKEIVIPICPKCSAKSQFEVDKEGGGYRCTKCSNVYGYGEIKCDDCGKGARVTHLKKMLATAN